MKSLPPLPARPVLSVLVPVYNERATVAAALDALTAKRISGWDIEIIIIESNSTDGSRNIVLGYQNRPGVRLVLEGKPRGKGHAVRAGLAGAAGNVVLIQDADLEYDLADYEILLAPLVAGTHHFVLGSRHSPNQWSIREFKGQIIQAFILNSAHWFFTAMIDLSLGLTLRDPFTMYKVFRRECIAGLTFRCNRFDFDWELLIKIVRNGYRPIEIPVSYHSRSFKEGKKIRMFYDPLTWFVAWARARFGPLH
jgi:glycosyltransferase involved in cell wall biosynthesis